MIKTRTINFFICLTVLNLVISANVMGLQAQKIAKVYSGGEYLDFPCQTLDSFDDYEIDPANMEFSRYGGWKAHQVEATGYFRVEQIDGRWWAVDPEGYLYIHKAVNSVDLEDFTADEIYQMFDQYDFNGFGCWTDEDILKSSLKDENPMAYCPKISFIAEYRSDRDERIEMPVFDDEFVAYANNLAKGFASYVDDPMVFGYLSDNELSWRDDGLPAHLDITDHTDQNYITAINFLAERGKTVDNWDTEDQYAYIALMGERYYSVVSAAINAVDPNHMYLGTRCHSIERYVEDFMKNAGKYVDVFSTNHYNRWGARQLEISNMSEWAGCPLLITEFYAMEMVEDNGEGAGWSVEDQDSRSWFYDNYVSTLAQTGKLVGFHWFRYQDKENANKGIINLDGEPYTALLTDMQKMNSQIYNFIDYYDSKSAPAYEFYPEADAYFKGETNYGNDTVLKIKGTTETQKTYRASYIRFDLSEISKDVSKAEIKLYGIAQGSESGEYMAYLVEDNSWEETSIVASNKPVSSTLLKTWGQADDVVLDVTDVLNSALNGDKKLSICLSSSFKNGSVPEYASREYADERVRPVLNVYSDTMTSNMSQVADFDEDVNVYPNPATEILNVEVETDTQVRIFNSLGQVVYSALHNNELQTITINQWNRGWYLVELNDGNNVITKPFIKN